MSRFTPIETASSALSGTRPRGEGIAPPAARTGSGLAAGQASFAGVLGRMESSGPPDETPEARARRAAEEFVSVALVEPILRELRESSDAQPPFAPSRGEKQFRALLDAQLSTKIVRASGFGLVDRLARDLLPERMPDADNIGPHTHAQEEADGVEHPQGALTR